MDSCLVCWWSSPPWTTNGWVENIITSGSHTHRNSVYSANTMVLQYNVRTYSVYECMQPSLWRYDSVTYIVMYIQTVTPTHCSAQFQRSSQLPVITARLRYTNVFQEKPTVSCKMFLKWKYSLNEEAFEMTMGGATWVHWNRNEHITCDHSETRSLWSCSISVRCTLSQCGYS